MLRAALRSLLFVGFCVWFSAAGAQGSYVNWETPHVSPLALTPDGDTLLAVNTADGRLEIFDVTTATAVATGSVSVGVDPVSVRARTNTEAWVVNQISDSVSIVNLTTLNVIATLQTDDEPADVVFAGTPQRAFVSCSQSNTVLIFDPANLGVAPQQLSLFGEDPRALAASADGSTVFVAIFESGNDTTILGGGSTMGGGFPPNVVNHPAGPHAGTNPPPNSGAVFQPPLNPVNPAPPAVGMIVRKVGGFWLDDTAADWTALVSGPNAGLSGRLPGWDLVDHDVAVIDTATLGITYLHGLMNICMHLAVHPATGSVTVVGTEATNEIRFEPNLNGTFVRSHLAMVDPALPTSGTIVDLNPHLTYATSSVPQPIRDQSVGDPRGITWNAAGTRAYVSGKGSSNVVVIDAAGSRAGTAPTIEVGEGPTGLALDEARSRLYVLNHFGASISVIDTTTELELAQVAFHDPTPAAIRVGRKHLYDTHLTSGLGQVSCGSCHVDARMDRLAWDLGDPAGSMRTFNQNCIDNNCDDWHPMKGPMTTQTLQDIIGKEPHHWRGDRDGLEEFAGAFSGLLGDDAPATPVAMQEFEDFLATVHFPPNPFRNFDNSLPTSLPLPGQFTTGRFGPAGQPLPNGNAVQGLLRYRTGNIDANFLDCVSCHTLPTGAGANFAVQLPGVLVPIPPGPNGETQLFVTGLDGSTNATLKVPQLRNMYDKVGFDTTQLQNTAGFGFLHDGSVDSLARFINEPVFTIVSDQDTADMVAFMMAFAGSDLPQGSPTNLLEPLGPPSLDTHAAVGAQLTVDGTNNTAAAVIARVAEMQALADANVVGWVVKGRQAGIDRGYSYVGAGLFQSDRASEQIGVTPLRLAAATGAELTFTVVPKGAETRIGIDRDGDAFFDRDEIDGCGDPADAAVVPTGCGSPSFVRADCNTDGGVDISDPVRALAILFAAATPAVCVDACDSNDDGGFDIGDPIHTLGAIFGMGAPPAAPFPTCGVDPTADGLDCGSYPPGCP
ncbi:MAG: hypothetical protein AAF581_18705 [Planctomycetota bacterium]